MFIQTEATPNPATLKFLPGREVMGEGAVADFPARENAGALAAGPRLVRDAGSVARFFRLAISSPSPRAMATGSI